MRRLVALLLVTLIVLVTAPARAQVCGDIDGDGRATVTDGVNVLRMAAGLPVQHRCGEPVPTPTPQIQPTATPTPITDPLVDMLGTWQFTAENVSFQAMRQYRLTTVGIENGVITVRGTDQDGGEVTVVYTDGIVGGMVLRHSYCRTSVFAHDLGTDSIYGGITYFGHPEGRECAYTQTRDTTGVRISR